MLAHLSRRELVQGAVSGLVGAALLPALAQHRAATGSLRLLRQPAFAVPVPTPFTASLELDLPAHRRLLRFYRQAGADAVLAVSSTGEMLSLTWPEALQLSRSAHAVFGGVRTWASLSCGRDVTSCVQGARELRQAGAGLPVVIPGLLAGANVSEAEAHRRLLEVGRRAGGPLGLYEAINPSIAPAGCSPRRPGGPGHLCAAQEHPGRPEPGPSAGRPGPCWLRHPGSQYRGSQGGAAGRRERGS